MSGYSADHVSHNGPMRETSSPDVSLNAEKVLPVVTLSAVERADLFNAACRAHSGPATFVCRPCADAQDAVIERVIAARLAEALAIVKHACDGECKSPGKHTGCHAHEPYRVLATTVFPPAGGDG